MGQRTAINLTPQEEQTLRQWARAGTSEHRMVERAKVILLAHQGKSNLEIAERLKTRPARVSKWRHERHRAREHKGRISRVYALISSAAGAWPACALHRRGVGFQGADSFQGAEAARSSVDLVPGWTKYNPDCLVISLMRSRSL